jgi:hypothetical protein
MRSGALRRSEALRRDTAIGHADVTTPVWVRRSSCDGNYFRESQGGYLPWPLRLPAVTQLHAAHAAADGRAVPSTGPATAFTPMSDAGVTVVIQALRVGGLAFLCALCPRCSPSSAPLSKALVDAPESFGNRGQCRTAPFKDSASGEPTPTSRPVQEASGFGLGRLGPRPTARRASRRAG